MWCFQLYWLKRASLLLTHIREIVMKCDIILSAAYLGSSKNTIFCKQLQFCVLWLVLLYHVGSLLRTQHPVLLVGAVWAWGEVVGCFTAALPSENKTQEADGCRGKQWGRAVSVMGWSPSTPTASLLAEPCSVSCPGESSWWAWLGQEHLEVPLSIFLWKWDKALSRCCWRNVALLVTSLHFLLLKNQEPGALHPILFPWVFVVIYYSPEIDGSRALDRCRVPGKVWQGSNVCGEVTKPVVTKAEYFLCWYFWC